MHSSLGINSVSLFIACFILASLPALPQDGKSSVAPYGSVTGELTYREKIFLHCDRKLSLTGEMIRFKGYCVHRLNNTPVDLSKVLYVEILNDHNKSILSEKIGLSGGTGHGSIYIPRTVQTGTYYIRAYTRWMSNFDPDDYFLEKIYIVNPFLPLETIPEHPGSAREYNIRFYAQNNQLADGRKNEIAFHAVDQACNPMNLTGWLVGGSGDTLSSFSTYRHGFGLISFVPHSIDHYHIILVDPSGSRREIPLGIPVTRAPQQELSGQMNVVEHEKKLNVSIQQDQTVYGTRDKVNITIRTTGTGGRPVKGNMSISVYKSDERANIHHKNIYQYLNHTSFLPGSSMLPDDQLPFSDYDSETWRKIFGIIYSSSERITADENTPGTGELFLPETRGLMVGGTIFNNRNGNPEPGVGIYLAMPGNTIQLYNVRSGKDGRFFIQLLEQHSSKEIIVMPENDPEKYRIVLDNEFSDKFCTIDPVLFRPDEQMVSYIEELMLNLQINDAFSVNAAANQDHSSDDSPAMFGDPFETVLLEDYIKLPAVEELFIELVKTVTIRRRRDNYLLSVIHPETSLILQGEPVVLLDGVPVPDINPLIMYMDPIDIEKIEVFPGPFIQGDKLYYSLIDIITKQADYGHFELPAGALREPFDFLQYPDSFLAPDYSVIHDSSLITPDFRNLLYWNPEVITDENGTAHVSFYTSDAISEYRMVVQGLTGDGLAGCAEATLSVKETEE